MAFINTPDLRVLQDAVIGANAFLSKLGGDAAEARFKLIHAIGILTTASDGLADPALREAAFQEYATDDIEIDDEPATSKGEDGTWVAAWVWIPDEEEEKSSEEESSE
jgi:hypothetical protein